MNGRCWHSYGLKTSLYLCTLLFAAGAACATDFEFDWRFSKDDFAAGMMPGLDDRDWPTVNVPHDWSVEGPFTQEYGSGNGYAPGGIGWYRKHFTIDEVHKDKVIAVEFDGIYDYSQVWINGQLAGGRPYGYASFRVDLTPHIRFGEEDNVLAVRVDHSRFADSRWYTGSGIYRHVRLRIQNKLHIEHWGVYVTTPKVSDESATIKIETVVRNVMPKGDRNEDQHKNFALQSIIVSPSGESIANLSTTGTVATNTEETLIQTIEIKTPQRWSTKSPWLYTLKSRLRSEETVVDEKDTPFGIRTLRFDSNEGFFLNEQPMKLKGVCLHHDAGAVGAAVPDKVLERRLRLMQDSGANAIRTSHNPPAPELLDLCDRLGLLVMDEAFDEFTPPKNKWLEGRNVGLPSRFGYGEVFTEWAVRDIRDMVLRDRNHPCIIMWSIGNEIDYANDPFSHPVLGDNYRPEHPRAELMVSHAKPLVETVKSLDTSRPVTAALASIPMSNAVGLPQLLDVVGYNYQEQHYEADHATYPDRFIYGSENGDSFRAWLAVKDNDYIAGQFLWTGIDYLGEANRWPNRANGAGLMDLCGFMKPIGWFRKSLWSEKPVVYICAVSMERGNRRTRRRARPEEHWNWQANQTVRVLCYSNCTDVTLTLNNETIGTKPMDTENGVLIWELPFQAGTLKASGRQDGRVVTEYTLTTAGDAERIILSADRTELVADGRDVCHLSFTVVDAQGVRVPTAEHELTFSVKGPAKIIGMGNADLNSLDNTLDEQHKAYQGRGLAILQSERSAGTITVTATANGLETATVRLGSRSP